jgi:hypothetical protein
MIEEIGNNLLSSWADSFREYILVVDLKRNPLNAQDQRRVIAQVSSLPSDPVRCILMIYLNSDARLVSYHRAYGFKAALLALCLSIQYSLESLHYIIDGILTLARSTSINANVGTIYCIASFSKIRKGCSQVGRDYPRSIEVSEGYRE